MATKYIFPILGVIFLAAALMRITRTGNRFDPGARTWLIIAVIFAAVSGWLWFST